MHVVRQKSKHDVVVTVEKKVEVANGNTASAAVPTRPSNEKDKSQLEVSMTTEDSNGTAKEEVTAAQPWKDSDKDEKKNDNGALKWRRWRASLAGVKERRRKRRKERVRRTRRGRALTKKPRLRWSSNYKGRVLERQRLENVEYRSSPKQCCFVLE